VKDLRVRFSDLDTTYQEWAINEDNYTIENVAARAREFLFDENFKPLNVTTGGVQFGFIVAGYSGGAKLSEVWTFEIANGSCASPRLIIGKGVASAYAGGDPEVFARLANGMSNNISAALKAIGIPDSEIPAKLAVMIPIMGTTLVETAMPIQDAIELSEFFVDATALFTRFKRGAGTVGGPTESAAITKHEGFKWVHRKHYFDASLNPGGIRR
jgi:hypothetical protein